MFNEEAFFEKLKDKVADKPFFEQYKKLKSIANVLTYVFNIISILGFIFGAYYVADLLFDNFYVAISISIVLGYYFERLKRMSSEEFFQFLFIKSIFHKGWFILSLSLFIVSLLGTAYGLKKGTNTLSAPADIIAADDQAKAYEEKIKRLVNENTKLEKNKNQNGQIFWPSQKSIQANTKTIATLEKEVQRINQKTESYNDVLTSAHKKEVEITGWVFVGINIFFEFLFEICMAFIWYYYAISLMERRPLSYFIWTKTKSK